MTREGKPDHALTRKKLMLKRRVFQPLEPAAPDFRASPREGIPFFQRLETVTWWLTVFFQCLEAG